MPVTTNAAQDRLAADYARFRPATRFVQAFASDRAGSTTLYVQNGMPGLASNDPAYVPSATLGRTSLEVPRLTQDAILEKHGVDHPDFVSMDIENAEPKALAGFSINRYRPRLVCVEAHYAARQAILDYFATHEYVLVGEYSIVELLNMYFMPRALR